MNCRILLFLSGIFSLIAGSVIHTTAQSQTKTDSLKMVLKGQKDTNRVLTLDQLIWELKYSSADSALMFAKEAYALSDKLNYPKGKALALHKLGIMYWIKGELDTAIDTTKSAMAMFKSMGNTKKYLSCLNNLAAIYRPKGQYEKALKLHHEALRLREDLKDSVGLVSSHSNIGSVYLYTKDYSKAMQYFKTAERFAQQVKNINAGAQINNLINVGVVYRRINKSDSALLYYQKALKIAERHNIQARIATISVNIGIVHFYRNEYPDALKFFLKAKDIQAAKNFDKELTRTYQNIAETYYNMGRQDSALTAANKAYAMAKKVGYLEIVSNVENIFAGIYASKGDYKTSNEYLRKFIANKDSLLNIEKEKAMADLEAKYEFVKKQKKIELLEKDNELKKKQANIRVLQRNIAFAGAGVLLILVLAFGNRFRMRKKIFEQREALFETTAEKNRLEKEHMKTQGELKEKEHKHIQEELKTQAEVSQLKADKLKDALDHSNRELSATAMFVYQKNEILGNINEMVEEVISNTPTEDRKPLKKIKSLINNNIELTDDWDKFKLHFEKVHPRFFDDLSGQFSNLTQNELKHCAYLRIKLSGKEIARMLNVAPKSMQVARYRLKKKLELGTKDDLYEFIANV